MIPQITLVRGDGLAASCAALLLDRAGAAVEREESGRLSVPAIMIGDATQALVTDVFGRNDIFASTHRITSRVVAWGVNAEPRIMPHAAVVVSEEQLNARLRPVLAPHLPSTGPAWTIHASQPLPSQVVERRFGSRLAQAMAVRLSSRTDAASCWIESLDDGWLFLIPNSESAGWLLAVGAGAESLLSASRVIAPQIASASAPSASFAAYPRIADPICGAGWLACGSAAMAFDPICGDGTGNAVREAILAAAVVARHEFRQDLLDHYRGRLTLGFARHLEHCKQFYAAGHPTPWWRDELQQVLNGIEWCRQALGNSAVSRYRLRGFELERITRGP